ncbi:hypothetical protein ATCC90586_011163 [Pythium insidiosum]|nr:hypothetical protein ATCC90586_011163 [Pythium insidiosum]
MGGSSYGAEPQIASFAKGERVIKSGERGNVLLIIKSGPVVCSDARGVREREALRLSGGGYSPRQRALMTHEPRAANVAWRDVT